MEHLHNSLIKFADVAHSQEEKGIAKYGKPLDPLDKYDWLEMASEELVDAFKYLHAEQTKRKEIINRIREEIQTGVIPEKYDKINRLLDELEGEE